MNDLYRQFGTGYGVLWSLDDNQFLDNSNWAGISTGVWSFHFNTHPAYSFTNNSNTGFYFPNGSNVIFK